MLQATGHLWLNPFHPLIRCRANQHVFSQQFFCYCGFFEMRKLFQRIDYLHNMRNVYGISVKLLEQFGIRNETLSKVLWNGFVTQKKSKHK